jgi:hypothetical protein
MSLLNIVMLLHCKLLLYVKQIISLTSEVEVEVHIAADRQSTSSSGYRASLWDP